MRRDRLLAIGKGRPTCTGADGLAGTLAASLWGLLPDGRMSCPARVRPPGNLAGVREDPHGDDQKVSYSWAFSIQPSMKLTGAKSLWGGPPCRGRSNNGSIRALCLLGGIQSGNLAAFWKTW